ncbi:hypothetical protein [Paenibacillus sp. BC26]|uniref:hypothetical protein n=1 Tax=Paenibacillus sp. BC26 TaxID=1881032 RepID=UPI0008F1B07E|nr:hypothetical protein [Paenibacillus sp. BC26]SFS53905.1 hypothetical protein SAMN05428962_0672 [Paenibacillus sp. BC26]
MDKISIEIYCSRCHEIRWITAYPDQYKYFGPNTYPAVICMDCREEIERKLQDYLEKENKKS